MVLIYKSNRLSGVEYTFYVVEYFLASYILKYLIKMAKYSYHGTELFDEKQILYVS